MPQSDIKSSLEKLFANATRYQEFYDYYDGRHQLNFSSEKFKNKFGKRLQRLRQNLCKTVVKAPASRLEIVGFQSDAHDIEKKAWELWKKSKMPLHAGAVHREAFKTGDAYVIVWTDKSGKPRFYLNPAANVAVWRNAETDEVERAAKVWRGSDGFFYLNLYYRDSIEKYVTTGKHASMPTNPKAFDIRRVQGEEFPLKNPFNRVPVFHFRFDAEMQDQGNSILSDVIPLNDALNKSWADIMGAQEENMRRRRYVAGLQVEKDEETGQTINPFRPDDDILFSADSETKFGEFSDVELDKMISVLEQAIKAICLVSGVPPSYFNLEDKGSAISGEALRKLEARFTAIVQDAQRSFGETWSEIESFGMNITDGKFDADLIEIETQWTDAAPISMSELLDEGLKKLSLGWSIEQIQRDLGLSDEQITKMLEENERREQAKMEREAKFFDAGNNFNQE